MKRLLLTKENVSQYLKDKATLALGLKIEKVFSVKEITDFSNANYLFKIQVLTDQGKKSFVLKQIRRYNKRALRQGKKLFVNPARVYGEVKMLALLKDIWGQKFVPRVIYFDRINAAFLMIDVSSDGRLLVEEFRQNKIHPELGKLLGQLFGKLHGYTFSTSQEFAGNLPWKRQLLRVLIHDHWSTGLRKFFPNQQVNQFLKKAQAAKSSAVWLDPVYANILVKKNSAVFFDFDHAITYDPAIDGGILLAHWVWVMLDGSKKIKNEAKMFIRDYIKNYRRSFIHYSRASKTELASILNRTVSWLAFYLLSRTDGKSGSYFKDWPQWEEKIRQTGVDLFSRDFNNSQTREIAYLILH
ncbi:MAG: hypothetical protein A3A24_00100 [Candidatus Buchananbacteria bacterium RIFCSPLOWO2_01_FULL_46_12]|uniref:Aminoglycoside phosphotransferase domain-containing protein n=2 Tax=Candidatus Buchananiibacteriota TaxID=1817903 RepID=A0A1G1YNP9_9BACT|nr:MAG: hypothetical protein A2744_01080 [Candidatus Buchananbacteria bacterium RIFCSPHIGHO2_01_FULL_44_11]OGY53978.1 MAG: hypothetical protein A3A24_00100 [Candidatus Buchananbacteria bacterium RIFCSPLOWO2_01_FULL_46_12]